MGRDRFEEERLRQAEMGKHRRFFIDPEAIVEGEVTIAGESAHQIACVLRLKPGDHVTLLDGSGCEHDAELMACSRDAVHARITRKADCETEPRLKLTLAMCIPKGDKLDLIVQKCTELGISRIVAVDSERTVARPDPSKVVGRLVRWRKIAAEAAEQTGRAKVPDIEGVVSFAELAEMISEHALALLAWEDEGRTSLKQALAGHGADESVMLIVGPEGGLTEREVELARQAGAKCVSLGCRVLRSETAAIAACAAIFYELEGEL